MLFYAKPFNEKMRDQLVKIWEKRKKCGRPIDGMKTRKNTNLFCCYKNTQQQPKYNNIYGTGQRPATLLKRDPNTDVFFGNF